MDKDLFIVSRASNGIEKPCNEAVQFEEIYTDIRVVGSPDELGCMTSEQWYSEGSNHRIINGKIARDTVYNKEWAVKLATLESLMDFIKKYGECVVYYDREYQYIKIYDDYIE